MSPENEKATEAKPAAKRKSAPKKEIPKTERDEALMRIKKRRDFEAHAFIFCVVNAVLWVLWAATGAGYPWPIWITGLWAIGLVINAWDVFFRRPITESEIQREMDRQKPA
jgi:hypothetical protein